MSPDTIKAALEEMRGLREAARKAWIGTHRRPQERFAAEFTANEYLNNGSHEADMPVRLIQLNERVKELEALCK